MRFLKKKRFFIPVAVAVAMIAGGTAFAYFTAAGAGTGSGSVGTASGLEINQTGVTAYNSRLTNPLDYNYSQCFYLPFRTSGDRFTSPILLHARR
jgi:hypothetical protein